MPEPQVDPHLPQTRRVAMHALVAGIIITSLKFGVFWLTDSVAVLSDALESIINIAAAALMLYLLWLQNRPADPDHPYGHGKAEVLAVGFEGWMILFSGLFILVEAVRRLLFGNPIDMDRLMRGWWLLAGIGVLSAGLAVYVWWAGRRYDNPTLKADGRHLATDVASTVAVLLGLLLVQWTQRPRVDAVVALLIAGFILFVSWRLLWQSVHGIMDRADPEDNAIIRRILDEEIAAGRIGGYHKVRYRHTGRFHWVDMHLQIEGSLSVAEGHALASRIERRIEEALGEANATAHVEPWEGGWPTRATPEPASSPDASPPPATADSEASAEEEDTYPLKEEGG